MMDFGNWGYPKRPKHLERQIGEQFDYDGVRLEVWNGKKIAKAAISRRTAKR